MGYTKDFADGDGKNRREESAARGGGVLLLYGKPGKFWSLLTNFTPNPRHTYKNQSSQRVCKDPFLVSCAHLRHWLPGTDAADFGLGGKVEGVIIVFFASR